MSHSNKRYFEVPEAEITQAMRDWCIGSPIRSRTAPDESVFKGCGIPVDIFDGYTALDHDEAYALINNADEHYALKIEVEFADA